ncbi:MAG: hypothetical protein ACRENQ_03330 [Gemmatimonadaceae bacterium]
MKTAWKGLLLSVAIALAACDQHPTAVPPAPSIRGTPTTVATSGVTRSGQVLVANGSDADTLVRHAAARWAAQGHRALQMYVDTSSLWDGRVARAADSKAPAPPSDDGSGATDLSYLQASMGNESIKITLNGRQAIVVSKSDYVGSDARTDLMFGANYVNGDVDVPAQTYGADDGHFLQKLACASEVAAGSNLSPACLSWTGSVTVTAYLVLSGDCGEYAYGSATTTAWYELPIPELSVGSSGPTMKLGWKKFGQTGPVATGRTRADQPACSKEIKKLPSCSSQLIYDPSGCDPGADGDMFDSRNGSDRSRCQAYLVQISESYDGGRTWTVVASWIEIPC